MYEPNSEQIQTVIMSQDIIDSLAELRVLVNEPSIGIEIEPLKIYCQKTGHIVGERDQNSIFSLTKIRGKNHIVSALYNSVSLSVHPAWVEDSGRDLDNLIDSDPIGYAVYCFGIITKDNYQNAKNSDRKREPWVERYWSLARANWLMKDRGNANLPELNQTLCNFLTYSPDTISYLKKRVAEFGSSPDMLALLHVNGELVQLLKDCTNRALAMIGQTDKYIEKTRFVDYAATPADAARGASNIRQQKVSKRSIKEATMFSELSALLVNAGIDLGKSIANNAEWREKHKQQMNQRVQMSRQIEADMLKDLQEIGGTNLDFLDDNNAEDDDNSIEVRTFQHVETSYEKQAQNSIENVSETINASDEQQANKLETIDVSNIKNAIVKQIMPVENKPKLSALEMLRAKRGQK